MVLDSQFAFVRHHRVEIRPRPRVPEPRLEDIRFTDELRRRNRLRWLQRTRGARWFMRQMRAPQPRAEL